MMNSSNIKQVKLRHKKNIIERSKDLKHLLFDWHPIIINSMPQLGTLRGIAPDKKKVAVLIALEKLSHENGLFLGEDVEMDTGDAVVFDGGESIIFPGNGGGPRDIVAVRYLIFESPN
ncbi:uncharacterized protein CIMG_05006 [Coccidioides immitis RS]|uniref:Uncharacterized protein n=1 Tax=Coccidioides immitis (strain RS) TaxID=246410 RepID=J3KEQ0_COCIM|nr:uncharacterized protein CIMG_05006 [Coccidioides immitis RS]EAS33982.3 hypothetical protein CIMG_05006 [Coccidioides immitis RS]TPX21586.1 hypothetical protein DIZ76_015545 [Coccidioides immitis]